MNLNSVQLNKQKKILIVIFFVLIVYVDNSFILKSQRAGLNSLGPKIARLNKDLTNLNQGLENMHSSKSKPGLLTQKRVIRSSKILREGQISELLQEISVAANKFDVKISQIRPSRETVNAKNVISGDKFTSILINLDLTCDYHNLGKFINTLESSLVFLGVQELVISAQPSDYMNQKVKLVLKTYVTK